MSHISSSFLRQNLFYLRAENINFRSTVLYPSPDQIKNISDLTFAALCFNNEVAIGDKLLLPRSVIYYLIRERGLNASGSVGGRKYSIFEN